MAFRLPRSTALLALLLALALPATAFACPIAIRTIGPLPITGTDLRRPVNRTTTREAWGLDESWVATRPVVSQIVKLRSGRVVNNVSYAKQQAISIDARGPHDTGWMYINDFDDTTPECQMLGEIEYQTPKIRVRQTATEVRIIATAQKTVGDRTGCILGPDNGVRQCPNLARVIVRLAKPLGNRKLVLESYPEATAPTTTT